MQQQIDDECRDQDDQAALDLEADTAEGAAQKQQEQLFFAAALDRRDKSIDRADGERDREGVRVKIRRKGVVRCEQQT